MSYEPGHLEITLSRMNSERARLEGEVERLRETLKLIAFGEYAEGLHRQIASDTLNASDQRSTV